MLLGRCRSMYLCLQLVCIFGSDKISAWNVRVLHQPFADLDHVDVVRLKLRDQLCPHESSGRLTRRKGTSVTSNPSVSASGTLA